YIGSHVVSALSRHGHKIIIYDNFSNSQKTILNNLKKLIEQDLIVIEDDVRNTASLIKAFNFYNIDSVIHLAGLKSIGDSNYLPIEYYSNNVGGAISLLEAMRNTKVKNIIFSSSATVYGEPQYLPIDENHPRLPTNPYGRTKLYIEEMLRDASIADPYLKIICLRYFNPVGADNSGLIGERPNGVPNNLIPYVSQVVTGKLEKLFIYGNDYPTSDGTGIRDYIHVSDLALGHLAALNHLVNHQGWAAYNLGSGTGYSVYEIVKVFESISGKNIKTEITQRRPGDVAACYASINKAKTQLGWLPKENLKSMGESVLNFEKIKFQM
ncbi:UDP-glucose 4-epimerase GalE, partial [bacterium]|nr:UDP-glucose 4-epimerase GalE [Candidatus Elulimicrobium humile]